jgi:Carboxypeptidase regulatory-like domain
MPFSTKSKQIGCTIIFGSVFLCYPNIGAYEVDQAVRGVMVDGRVTFTGPLPKPEALPVHRDSKFCGETVQIEPVQLDRESRGIAEVVVSLEHVERGKPITETQAYVFENRSCRFVPRSNAAIIGSSIEIRNADPILHNTHIRMGDRFGPTVVNVAQPAGTPMIQKPLREAGLMDVRCDAHPFMHATVHVFDHPYFAITSSSGRFELTQVPPGTYKLRAWHQKLGAKEKSIVISAGQSVTMDVEFGSED